MKHTMTIDIDVPELWIEYLTLHPDIFGAPCGYWARGVVQDADRGWLVWEHGSVPPRPCGHHHGDEPDLQAAEAAWKAGKLPQHWHRLDRDAAVRAWVEGVKHWGVAWYDHADATRYDVVVQLALLGEVRYG